MIFNILTESYKALLRTLGMVSMQMLVFYFNLKILLPIFYRRKKYVSYSLINLGLLLIGVLVIDILIRISFACNSSKNGFKFSTIFNLRLFNLTSLEIIFNHMMPILLAIFIGYIIHTHTEQKKLKEQELLYINTEKKFLVSQINPHFLLNILNNIYSLTLNDNKKGAEGIMQLSKMLDYSLYGAKKGLVSLEEEILYITKFIHLFKLKDDEIEQVFFEYSGIEENLKIAPMLLIPFVENAFKHGNVEDVDNGYIEISLKTTNGVLHFTCKNTYEPKKSVDTSKGIGICNVKRRLKLIYDKRCRLHIDIDDHNYNYTIKLNINTNDM